MADIHNALRRSQLSSALKNFLGDTRGESGLERYGETLTPTVDMWEDGERNILRDELLFFSFTFQAAVAAEFGAVGIGLPVASKDLLIIRGASGRGATTLQAGQTTRAIAAGTLNLASNARNSDQRAAASGFVALNLGNRVESWTGSDPAALISIGEEVNALTQAYEPFRSAPWIVKPGGVFLIQAGTVNVAIGVNIWGRVRAAKTGELFNV